MSEIWKDIPGQVGYQASNLGRIKSLDKVITANNRWGDAQECFHPSVILATSTSKSRNGNRYERVTLKVANGKRICAYVHRLVAFAFLRNENYLLQVNHKDGNTLNNNVENLEWVTQSENILHSYRVLGKGSKGKPIRVGDTHYASLKQATQELDVSLSHLWKVLNGIKRTVKGMKAEYV
jgi:hypothetical protein